MNHAKIRNLPKPDFTFAESLNTLATNLSYCGENVKTILMTSRYAYEGKSCIAMNLMRTIASLQKRVVLIDTDLRCSNLVSDYRIRFPGKLYNGLAHYLAGMCKIEDIVYQTNVDNAYLVPVGRAVTARSSCFPPARCRS